MTTNTKNVRHSEADIEGSANPRHEPPAKPTLDRRHIWFTTPLLVALFGLIATGITALVPSYSNSRLERHKFEYLLVQKALSAPSRKEAAQYLGFLNDVGLLSGLDKSNVAKASEGNGEQLPIFLGAAIRDQLITIPQAKEVLSHLNEERTGKSFYTGPIDNDASLPFRIAVMKFQRDKKLEIDGYIGPKTVLSMWEACPECPGLLRILDSGHPGSTPPGSSGQ